MPMAFEEKLSRESFLPEENDKKCMEREYVHWMDTTIPTAGCLCSGLSSAEAIVCGRYNGGALRFAIILCQLRARVVSKAPIVCANPWVVVRDCFQVLELFPELFPVLVCSTRRSSSFLALVYLISFSAQPLHKAGCPAATPRRRSLPAQGTRSR